MSLPIAAAELVNRTGIPKATAEAIIRAVGFKLPKSNVWVADEIKIDRFMRANLENEVNGEGEETGLLGVPDYDRREAEIILFGSERGGGGPKGKARNRGA